GQIWFLIRVAGATGSAAIIARFSPLVAAIVLGSMLLQRAILRRQYVTYVNAIASASPARRAARYWTKAAGTLDGAKELRTFGFGAWAVERQYDWTMQSHEPSFAHVRRVVPQQWMIFLTAFVGFGIGFYAVTAAALDGTLSPGELAATL